MKGTAVTRTFWRSYFRVYDRMAQAIPYQRLLQDGAKRLSIRSNGLYLDLGCGTGNSTAMIAQELGSGGRVIGIDRSVTAIDLAQAKLIDANGIAKVSLWQSDFEHGLEFKHQRIDGVLANNVIYLVKDPVQTLAEVLRVLKPGAHFVMSNPKRGASPSKILIEHLRLKREAYREQGASFSNLRTIFHGVVKFADFLRLLPFQLLLKHGSTVEARFWSVEEWQEVFDRLSETSNVSFEVSPPEPTYADQNYSFTLTRLG